MAILTFLMIGWILSWFGFNKLFIQGFKELFKLEITKASYYLVFFCIGLFGISFYFSKELMNLFYYIHNIQLSNG